jgi:phosphoenolpyruvate carboxykinase (GTP)
MSSETTAAAVGETGKLRHDPFAMLPFCGYHMGDYFAHWLTMASRLPPIFHVNWFQKSPDGKFLWPGFGENTQVLKWIFERTSNKISAQKTPIGYLPEKGAFQPEDLLKIDRAAYLKEVEEMKEYFKMFKDRLPAELKNQLHALEDRLCASSSKE